MRKGFRLNNNLSALGLAILLLLLTACSPSPAREWLKAPGWSHGLPVAETRIGDPVPMALDDAGNVYLFLVTAENETSQPTIIALNRQAETVWKRTLAFPLSQPDKPTVVWDGRLLNLFWISDHRLYTAQMNTAGDIVGPVREISGGRVVDSYDTALDADGSLTVWYAGQRRSPGLYMLDGDLAGEATLVDAEGIRPTLQYDETGALYAVWAHYPLGFEASFFFYAVYPDGKYEAGRETAVYQPYLATTDILIGPQLGLDQAEAYLIWNISVRTGPEAGKVVTQYIHFPKGEAAVITRPETIIVPSVSDLEYASEPDDGLTAGPRIFPVTGQYPGTPKVDNVALNGTAVPEQELALAFSVQALHEFRKTRNQIGTLFLQDGEPTGYQLLSYTSNASIDPAIISDEAGQLYLTWLERGKDGGFQVYFTSTAADMQKPLSSVTWGDVGRISRETLFGLLSGAVLAPVVVLLWMIFPLLALFATAFLRRKSDDALTHPGTIVSLLLAGAMYWGGKLLTIPGIGSFVPFSAWIPAIPTWLQSPLQIGVPLLITMIAIYLAWRLTYRRSVASLLYFAILVAAIDGVLTMAIYGFLFYNLI